MSSPIEYSAIKSGIISNNEIFGKILFKKILKINVSPG